MKRHLALPVVSVLILSGCMEVDPAGPQLEISPEPFLLSEDQLSQSSLDFSADLTTIVERVLPGFSKDEAEAMRADLDELSAQLSTSDFVSAKKALASAWDRLTPETTNRIDYGYIEMVFRNIETALRDY